MIVQLIPFFLAANMSDDVRSWSRGPEMEFNLTLRLKQMSLVGDRPSLSHNMTMAARCRPKETDSLSCMLLPEKVSAEASTRKGSGTIESAKKRYLELKFNEAGVESITADGNVMCDITQLVKRIPSTLSIGANLKKHLKKQDGIFETQEDIAMGRCTRSTYQIKTTPQEPNETHPPNLHLIVTPLQMPDEKTTIEISKVRDVDTCNGTSQFFKYSQGGNTETKITHAVANMIITSPGTFTSNIDYRGEAMNEFKNETIGFIEEFLQIELVSVKEATNDPYVVENPSTLSPMLSPCPKKCNNINKMET